MLLLAGHSKRAVPGQCKSKLQASLWWPTRGASPLGRLVLLPDNA